MNLVKGLPWWLRVVDKWLVQDYPKGGRLFLFGDAVFILETELYQCKDIFGNTYVFVKCLTRPQGLSSADHDYILFDPLTLSHQHGFIASLSYPSPEENRGLYELKDKRFIRTSGRGVNELWMLFKRVGDVSNSTSLLPMTDGEGGVNL